MTADTNSHRTDHQRTDELFGWAREFFETTAPYATEDAYVNLLSHDEQDRARAAYDDSYERLVDLKGKWDPENVFRTNQNIDPDR